MITRRGFMLGTLSAGMAAALAKVMPRSTAPATSGPCLSENDLVLMSDGSAKPARLLSDNDTLASGIKLDEWETAFDPASPEGDYDCSVTWFDAERRVIGRVDHLKPNTTYYPQFNLKSGDLEMIEAYRSEQSTNKNLLTSKYS